MKNNKKKGLIVSSTVVGLVCGLALTQQQAKAATVDSANDQNSTIVQAPKADKATEPNTIPADVNSNDNTNAENNSIANTIENQPTSDAHQDNTQSATNEKQNTPSGADNNVNDSINQITKTQNVVTKAAEPEMISQGTWGTCKWEYQHDGDDYVLHVHEGTLEVKQFSDAEIDQQFLRSKITKIIIDPNVSLGKGYGKNLFSYLVNLKTIDGLSNLDISNATDISRMFYACFSLTSIDLRGLNTSNVTNMSNLFASCSSLTSIDLRGFNTSNATNMSNLFAGCSSLTSIDLNNFDTSKVTDMSGLFGGCSSLTSIDLNTFDTSKVTNMSGLFSDCSNLTGLDLNNFNTSKVTDMSHMFAGCSKITSLHLNHFNTMNVENMYALFKDCSNLSNIDLSSFDTSKVTDLSYMFKNCSSLKTLDLSNFDTSNVESMVSIFEDCSNLTSIKGISEFKLSRHTDIMRMFTNCSKLTKLDLSNFDVDGGDCYQLFANCSSLTSLDIRNLEISTGMTGSLFENCVSLNHLVLGPKMIFFNASWGMDPLLPEVPAVGTPVPGTNKKVTAPYWVATSGYEQGKQYTSKELIYMESRGEITAYDWVAAVPVVETSTESKAVSRLINIHQPDGTVKSDTQTAIINRTVTVYDDGSVDYGKWSSSQWDAYQIPAFAGYGANLEEIPAGIVNGQTVDQTVDVYYTPVKHIITIQYIDSGKVVATQEVAGYPGNKVMPDYQIPTGYEVISPLPTTITVNKSGKQIIKVPLRHQLNKTSELKTLTRTINIHQPNGSVQTYSQVAVLSRPVTEDRVTGQKIYGAWNTARWSKFVVPTLTGYIPSNANVAAKAVTSASKNERIDIYYKKAK